MNTVFILIIAILITSFALEQVMQYLNGKSWTGEIPERLKDLYNGEEYTKAQNYDFEKKKLSQWFLNITKYSEELLKLLDKLDGWPDKVKLMQKNWIGRSEACEIDFVSDLKNIKIKI